MDHEQDPRNETSSQPPPAGYAPPEGPAVAAPATLTAPNEQKASGKAVASLVCGIVGLIVAGIILGIIAVVLGVVAKREIAADPRLSGNGLATGGIVTGAIAFVLAIVVLIVLGPTIFG